MAMEVGAVYLSAYLDGEGIEKGLYSVKAAAEESLGDVGSLLGGAFVVKPTFDLAQMTEAVRAGVEQASGLIGPIIDLMGQAIAEKSALAIGSLGGIAGYVSGGFSKQWSAAWNAVGEGFKGTWKGIANFFVSAINTVISGINTALAGLNRLSVKMPDWMGGQSFGFNLPMIAGVPFLANGGIVTKPTLAMVGEAGSEAVLPLGRGAGWMAELAQAIGSVVAAREVFNAGAKDGGGVANLYIDGRKFAEATIDEFARAGERRGIALAPAGA